MIKTIVSAVVFALLFVAISFAVLVRLPPAAGVLWSLSLGAAFLGWHLRSNPRSRERRALVRLQRPTGGGALVATVWVATLLLAFGQLGLIELFSPPVVESDLSDWQRRSLEYQSTLGGIAGIICLGGLVIPMVEEFCFRGYVQHTLERRFAPWAAIGIASLVFVVGHIGGPRWSFLLLSLTLGVGLGTAAYLFESVWVGVGVHASWNVAMTVLDAFGSDPMRGLEVIGEPFLLPLSVVALGLGSMGWYRVGKVWRRERAGAVPIASGSGTPAHN